MSRIDEAIRQVADMNGTEAEGNAVAGTSNDLQSENVDDLANEPFPLELSERRRHQRPAPQVLRPPVPADVPRPLIAHPEPVMKPAQPAPAEAGSLLERIDESLAEKIVADANMNEASREQYRRLAATLHHLQSASGVKVVMIASAVPGEGKTLTASNLGLTFSESYQRTVLLIDADLRRPSLHQVFGIDNAAGLTEGLAATAQRKLPVRRISERLFVIPGGQATSDPMAGLTSDRMRHVLDEAREAFDWIIIDTPPVALLPDANLLSAMVDGAVLVIKAGSTAYPLVKRAVEAITRPRILGVVLNQAESVGHESSYNYEYGSRYYSGRTTAEPPVSP